MTFEEASKHLDDCLTAVLAAKKAAQKARDVEEQALEHQAECQYWADKFKKKLLLFQDSL